MERLKYKNLQLPSGNLWLNKVTDEYYDFNDVIELSKEYELPTIEDFKELLDNTDSEVCYENGVYGRKFTSKHNGVSIFFPHTGYFEGERHWHKDTCASVWSTTEFDKNNAYYLTFYSLPDIGVEKHNGFGISYFPNSIKMPIIFIQHKN